MQGSVLQIEKINMQGNSLPDADKLSLDFVVGLGIH